MAAKAICCVTDTQRDSNDHSHFVATVRYAGLVDTSYSGTHYVYDLDPSALGTALTNTIQAEMKTFLTNEGMTFGLLDYVRVVPGVL